MRATITAYAKNLSYTTWRNPKFTEFTPGRIKIEVLAGLTVASGSCPRSSSLCIRGRCASTCRPICRLYSRPDYRRDRWASWHDFRGNGSFGRGYGGTGCPSRGRVFISHRSIDGAVTNFGRGLPFGEIYPACPPPCYARVS